VPHPGNLPEAFNIARLLEFDGAHHYGPVSSTSFGVNDHNVLRKRAMQIGWGRQTEICIFLS
jgi:hypothetical protein